MAFSLSKVQSPCSCVLCIVNPVEGVKKVNQWHHARWVQVAKWEPDPSKTWKDYFGVCGDCCWARWTGHLRHSVEDWEEETNDRKVAKWKVSLAEAISNTLCHRKEKSWWNPEEPRFTNEHEVTILGPYRGIDNEEPNDDSDSEPPHAAGENDDDSINSMDVEDL